MLFNSLTFALFFAFVLSVFSLRLPWGFRKTFLLVASYAFYAAWNPPFVILLWLSTVVDWVVGGAICRTPTCMWPAPLAGTIRIMVHAAATREKT